MASTAEQQLTRHTRKISCKTYLKRLNVTQAMSDQLLPPMQGSLRASSDKPGAPQRRARRASPASAAAAAAATAAVVGGAAEPGPAAAPSLDAEEWDPPGGRRTKARGKGPRPGGAREYELLFKAQIKLVDACGQEHAVTYEGTLCAGQRHLRLTCGWSEFAKAHKLAIGDSVTFERRGSNWGALTVTTQRAGQPAQQPWQGELPRDALRVLVGSLQEPLPGEAAGNAAPAKRKRVRAARAPRACSRAGADGRGTGGGGAFGDQGSSEARGSASEAGSPAPRRQHPASRSPLLLQLSPPLQGLPLDTAQQPHAAQLLGLQPISLPGPEQAPALSLQPGAAPLPPWRGQAEPSELGSVQPAPGGVAGVSCSQQPGFEQAMLAAPGGAGTSAALAAAVSAASSLSAQLSLLAGLLNPGAPWDPSLLQLSAPPPAGPAALLHLPLQQAQQPAQAQQAQAALPGPPGDVPLAQPRPGGGLAAADPDTIDALLAALAEEQGLPGPQPRSGGLPAGLYAAC